MQSGRSSRRTRFSCTVKLASVVILLVCFLGYFGLALLYVQTLSHPECNQVPPPLSGFHEPDVVWLSTDDRVQLRAWYYPPQNGVVIIALGGVGGALGDTLPPVAFLIEKGFGVLQIDQRGCGHPAMAVTLGANEVRDAAAALNFLKGQVEVQQIGAFGFSMGGVTAIRSAARNPEIAAVVAEGGYYNMGNDMVDAGSRLSPARKAFLYTIAGMYWLVNGINPWQISPIDDLALISPRAVFLVYGEHEVESGHAQAQFDAALPPKQFWIVPEGSHGNNHLVAPKQYQSKILEFFNRTLLR